jgi:hypothetical protein
VMTLARGEGPNPSVQTMSQDRRAFNSLKARDHRDIDGVRACNRRQGFPALMEIYA